MAEDERKNKPLSLDQTENLKFHSFAYSFLKKHEKKLLIYKDPRILVFVRQFLAKK